MQILRSALLIFTASAALFADHIPQITTIVDGVAYTCGLQQPLPPPPPEFQLYCSCQVLFGQTSLNLMAFNPQTGKEQKVRELARFAGTAVHPGMEQCRAAVKAEQFVECLQ